MKFLIVILFLSLSTLIYAQDNLVQNSGCELPLVNGKIPYWVEVAGNDWTKRTANPAPYKDQGYFSTGSSAEAELAQTIDLAEYTCSIDQGNQSFFFIAFVNAANENPPDQATIILEVLDGSNSILASYTLGPYGVVNWAQVSKSFSVPVKTRKIKIRLLSHRRSGATNDGYFDEITLVPLPGGRNFTIASVNTLPASCGRSDGVLSVNVAAGPHVAARQYSVDGQTFQVASTFLNLPSKDYVVTVKDGGCVLSQTATVGRKTPPKVDNIQSVSANCGHSDGSLSLNITGGSPTTMYSLNGQAPQSSPTFRNLASGNYTITLTDNGCVASQTAIVGNTPLPHIDDMQVTESGCGKSDGRLTLVTSGGKGNRQYSLDGQPFQSSATFQNLAVGSYTVTVRDEANCTVKQEASINLSGDCYIYVPDAFSPNHDGINDYFQLISGYQIDYTIQKLTIYSRWGEALFSRENFSILDKNGWWDGTSRGEGVEAGSYTYYFEYVNIKNETVSRRGAVIVLR